MIFACAVVARLMLYFLCLLQVENVFTSPLSASGLFFWGEAS